MSDTTTASTLEAAELRRIAEAYEAAADRLEKAGSGMAGPFRDQATLLRVRWQQAETRVRDPRAGYRDELTSSVAP